MTSGTRKSGGSEARSVFPGNGTPGGEDRPLSSGTCGRHRKSLECGKVAEGRDLAPGQTAPCPFLQEIPMAKVLVLYYSSYGHVEQMAQAIAEGARAGGASVVDIKRVPETAPAEVAKNAHFKLDQAAPVATVADL